MRIALYGKTILDDCTPSILQLISRLQANACGVLIFEPFLRYLRDEKHLSVDIKEVFADESELIPGKVDFMMSIGGDGTFLETVSFVREKGIPVIGLNTGRLGFLANIGREDIDLAVRAILNDEFQLEERSLIQLEGPLREQFRFPLALNEFVVQKAGLQMVTVHARVNGELLNSYLADGLIISTPTGSTAYSMSAGGPIVMPNAGCFIISPIAPHNLTMRPIIVPDNSVLEINTESRNPVILASLDYQSLEIPANSSIRLCKAPYTLLTVRLKNHTYFETLRNKLMWGADRRK
ncbi:MAG: NAD kinase [Bacteroidales bacterium]